MEENIEQIQMNENYIKQPLSNGTTALVLGILSIVMACCCVGVTGIIIGIIGLVLGSNAVKTYHENMGIYTEASYKNANAGKICSIIGLILGVFYVVMILLQWSLYVAMFTAILNGTFDPNDFMNY